MQVFFRYYTKRLKNAYVNQTKSNLYFLGNLEENHAYRSNFDLESVSISISNFLLIF